MSMRSPLAGPNVGLLFRNLFGEPECVIAAAPPHKLRLWLGRIKLELRRERNRGKTRHYRYVFNRHLALAAVREIILKKLGESCQ